MRRYIVLVLMLPMVVFLTQHHEVESVQAAGVVSVPYRDAPEPTALITTTTTEAPTTTTLDLSRTVTTRANRGSPRDRSTVTTTGAPISGPDFWKRLSICENPSGNAYGGFFQFTDPGTAKKAGYVPGSSYGDQLAAAKRWAAIIHPREGTSAGWPHCWWVALAGGK